MSDQVLPFQSRFVTVAGHKMHYLDEGEGPVVLLFHGNPTWSFYYRHLIRSLSPQLRCIAPDHIGMGLSDRPDDERYDYTLKSRVHDLEQLMEAVAPTGPVTLIVHDWGGMIGMTYASRFPERIGRLVLLNTAAQLLTVLQGAWRMENNTLLYFDPIRLTVHIGQQLAG